MVKKPVIGLLGGGQLGRMLQEAAALVGVEIIVLDQESCPTRQINQNGKHVTGSFNDPEKIRELAMKSDLLTVEIEHVNTDTLEEIATKGVRVGPDEIKRVPCHPSWETIRLIQDKYLQKEHLKKAGLPVAPQLALDPGVSILEGLQDAAQKLGFPFMLKARKGSYDGRGNFQVKSAKDFEEAVRTMGKLQLYAEKWVPFVKELAVMVVRTEDDHGSLRGLHAYPAVETIHEDSICSKVIWPPRQTEARLSKKAEEVATGVVRSLKGRGVFAVEMFLTQDGIILVNEIAPRPHNSGHLWIEAVPYMSQFKAQLYSILDIFPAEMKLQPRVHIAMMLNILGGANENSHDRLVTLTETLYRDEMDIFLHLYGKASKPSRKIGHITVTSHSKDSDLQTMAQPLNAEVDSIRQHRLASIATASSSQPPTAPKHSSSISSRDPQNPLVVITMGSDSDLPVLKPCFQILEHFRIPYDYTITSAHRTPHRMVQLGQPAAARGIRVLIAAAGGAAHLPGMLASETTVPVIGVPIKATHLDGHDSLLSIVQMPRGCPVATVGINNGTNAALLAVKILGTTDEGVRGRLGEYMKGMREEVEGKAGRLREVGWEEYLK